MGKTYRKQNPARDDDERYSKHTRNTIRKRQNTDYERNIDRILKSKNLDELLDYDEELEV